MVPRIISPPIFYAATSHNYPSPKSPHTAKQEPACSNERNIVTRGSYSAWRFGWDRRPRALAGSSGGNVRRKVAL